MTYGYIRVSTVEQNADSQKNVISRYVVDRKGVVDRWIEIEMSTRKSKELRGITSLLEALQPDDTVIVSELSRLGRSIREVLESVETILHEKKAQIVFVKQNLHLAPNNADDMTSKILLTVFSMLAELERDFVSQRTKEGLAALKAKGVRLGKPKGTVQTSMYDKDKERIFHLYGLGVPIQTIVKTHLKYGTYGSLKNYLHIRSDKKKPK